MLLHNFLRETAKKYPDREAIVHLSRRMTFALLDSVSNNLANHLITLSVKPGDRVILCMENCCEYICAYFATLKAGAVVVPVNSALIASEIQGIIQNCSPVAVLTVNRRKSVMTNLLQGIDSKGASIIVVDDGLCTNEPDNQYRLPSVFPDQVAAILYTSGTSGKPKGVMLTHENLCTNSLSIVRYLNLTCADKVAAILPFCYSYGNSLLTTHILAGGTLVIDNRFMYPNTVIETMRQESVTGFAGVPSHFAILLNKSSLKTTSLPSLRYVTQAGGHLPPEQIEEFCQILPHVQFYVMYGQTEASARLTYLEPIFLKIKVGSIGKAIPDVDIRVVNKTGDDAAPGESGEVIARGKNIMAGYWNDPDGTKQVLKDGWLYTGDLARRDEDGFLFIIDRKKEIIKTGANRVSPLEIEGVVNRMPGIRECAVCGTADPILGEAIRLFVVLNNDKITCDDIMQFCKKRLSPFKIPKFIEFLTIMPYLSSGKINRDFLRKHMLSGHLANSQKGRSS